MGMKNRMRSMPRARPASRHWSGVLAIAATLWMAHPLAHAQPPPEPFSVIRDCPTCPELVLLPEGAFLMGVPPGEEEREKLPAKSSGRSAPLHAVTLPRRFYMGKHTVTHGEYAAFIAAAGERPEGKGCSVMARDPNNWRKWAWTLKPGASWRDPGFERLPGPSDRHPAVCVSHEDARAYALWLTRETGKSYRLPSEAEWEYAARAVTSAAMPSPARYWGDERGPACRHANGADTALVRQLELRQGLDRAFAWIAGSWAPNPNPDRYFSCDDTFAFTAPAGSFPPNPFRLHDILGNVWQWTEDCWHATYAGSPPVDGSAWMTGGDCGRRVIRGGSWNFGPWEVRAGYRGNTGMDSRISDIGFRVVRPE